MKKVMITILGIAILVVASMGVREHLRAKSTLTFTFGGYKAEEQPILHCGSDFFDWATPIPFNKPIEYHASEADIIFCNVLLGDKWAVVRGKTPLAYTFKVNGVIIDSVQDNYVGGANYVFSTDLHGNIGAVTLLNW